jgi:hypothetical protein
VTYRLLALWPAVFVLASAGCGGASAPATDPTKLITWEQYVKMPAEDQADPYVLNNLAPEAQKRLSEKNKKTKK